MTHAIAPAIALGTLPPHLAAAVSYLARYTGGTHDLYQRHLGQYLAWCEENELDPLEDVTRGPTELLTYDRQDQQRLLVGSRGRPLQQ